MYTIDDLENDSNWVKSLGEKLDKIHFRNGNLHAECDPKTRQCSIHYDKNNPHESLTSLVKHLADSNTGKGILAIVTIGILDQIFTGGKLRKSLGSVING